ncbi:MAG: hypothetical protein H0X37_12635 [Herpetosiphonaceae bacterium]|nr:hypothetical protein [Herpetosiphonaceae bacterium]
MRRMSARLTMVALTTMLLAPMVTGASSPGLTPADAAACAAPAEYQAPAGTAETQINKDGQTVIPNGRFVTPAGVNVTVAPHPFGLTISPNGKQLVSANSGTAPFSISVVSQPDSSRPRVQQIPPGPNTDPAVLDAVFMGVAIARDNRTLYVSGGNDGNIVIFDLSTGTRTAAIDLNVPAAGRNWTESYIGDIKLSPDGLTLWAIDQANFRLVAVDVATKTVTKVAPAGRYPFGLAITPDNKTAYVANVGMYQYSFVNGFDPNNPTATGLAFPPFAQGSAAARYGTIVEGKTVPGLGSPNDPASFSVWAIDLASAQPVAKLKTGPLVGELVKGIPAVGGSSPNSVVTDGRRVYVSNNHSDSVTVIDVMTNRVVSQVPLRPAGDANQLRGTMPFGVALSPDNQTLFVAESGLNAVAVIDTPSLAVLGRIPVGWFPAKVAVAPDGQHLYVSNAKGYGAGPNGGAHFVPGPEGTYIGQIQKGTISAIELPDFHSAAGRAQLQTWSEQVLKNNVVKTAAAGATPPSAVSGQRGSCPIQHVIFVTKENRTYDEVFGDLGQVGNRTVNGDPTLARYGQKVTPNHHALARRFASSDNFYVDSDVSADGHRWLVGVAPDEFVETSWPASYGGRRNFSYDTSANAAPGRRGFTESNSALAPEEYPELGSIWNNFARNNISFYNYGEGFEFAGIFENAGYEPTGARLPVNVPMPDPLFDRTDRNFPTFNTTIQDQYRVDEFARDFQQRFVAGGEQLPQYINLYLPQDHTASPNPALGYPYTSSYVADNDLALGRVIDLVSHSKYWGSTAIFVTEDDAQSGVDHVDAHRSLLLVISPWTKQAYVSAQHSSIVSIIKTINEFTGAPPLSLYDDFATDLRDTFDFQQQPNLTPYVALPEDPTIFNPGPRQLGHLTAEQLRGGAKIDDPQDMVKQHHQAFDVPATAVPAGDGDD